MRPWNFRVAAIAVALLLLAPSAAAMQSLLGDHVGITWSDEGNWNAGGEGFRVRLDPGDPWVDFTSAGVP